MMKYLYTLFFATFTFQTMAQSSYKILDSHQKEITLDEMLMDLMEKDIVFFGEFHNNATIHQLQLQVYKNIQGLKNWAIGMEMLERDQNRMLQEFMQYSMSWETWKAHEKLWSNFESDYLPILLFAKEHRLPAVATNIPRYLASTVARNGWDSLDNYLKVHPEKKDWIVPLPMTIDYNAPGYNEFPTMFGEQGSHGMDIRLLTDAQAIKDATMAHSILQFLNTHPGKGMFHIQGNFHNKDRSGIIWYLNHYKSPYQYSSIEVYHSDKNNFDVEITTVADYYIIVHP